MIVEAAREVIAQAEIDPAGCRQRGRASEMQRQGAERSLPCNLGGAAVANDASIPQADRPMLRDDVRDAVFIPGGRGLFRREER
ncbi:hypothetical protein GCM10023174_09860 [Chelativorans composti]|jgi:hypothetical protein